MGVTASRVATVLFLLGLFATPWMAGRIPLDPMPLEPGFASWFDVTFLSRLEPASSLFVLSIPFLVALLLQGLPGAVLQLPVGKLMGLTFGFWVILAMSALASERTHTALWELCRWTLYLAVMTLAVICLGRGTGPRRAAWAFFGGASCVAFSGLLEYAATAQFDANWRIFGGWHHPNALASMLALALPIAAAALRSQVESADRKLAVLVAAALGSGAILCALWLTGSRGGLLAAGIGVAAMLAFAWVESRRRAEPVARGMAVALLAACLLGAGWFALTRAASGASGGVGRAASVGAEGGASTAFRMALWTQTARLAASRPMLGVGLGSFQPEYAKVGTIEAPKLAHNSYLQIAAEAGVPAVLLFLACAGYWLYLVSRPHPALSRDSAALRSGVVGAVFAGGASAITDSSFSVPGFSILFFVVLGVGLLLSPDGARPERLPLSSRLMLFVPLTAAVLYFFGTSAYSTVQNSVALDAMTKGHREAAESRAQSAVAASPLMATGYSILAQLASAGGEAKSAVEFALRAADLAKTSSAYARLGDAYAEAGETDHASAAFETAISLSPSNPHWRRRYFDFLIGAGEQETAEAVALKLVEMEGSDFFRLNPLPSFVDTSTVEPRVFLASLASSRGEKEREAEHLRRAFEVLVEYHERTFAELLRQKERFGEGLSEEEIVLAGESLPEARRKFEQLKEIASKLAATLGSLGRVEDAKQIESRVEELSASG